jgi:hypothetical protein
LFFFLLGLWNITLTIYCYLFDVLQKAIKEKKLDLWELEKEVLGTDKEKKVPPQKTSHGSGK